MPVVKQGWKEWATGVVLNTSWGRNKVLDKARAKVLEQSKGMYPAPLKILDVVKQDTDEAEAKGFGELLVTAQSAGLRHLFKAITWCKKDDGPGASEVDAVDVAKVGMLGAGLMGGGIAMVLADKGIQVRFKDINLKASTVQCKPQASTTRKQ